MKSVLILISTLCILSGLAEDVPCQSRPGDGGKGFICVCNSTYCDTLERPTKLVKGQFHWYSTSNSTPGFSHTTGSFIEPSVTDDPYIVFKINASVTFQEIIGFGGSFTDSSGIVFNTLPKAAQDKLMESYFGPNGTEYSLGRLPIGASDFSLNDYTLDDVPFDVDLKNFSLTYEDYTYKIPLIKKAMSLSSADRPIKFLGCTWLAPSWMKVNNDKFRDFLEPKYYRTFAEYHLKFLEAYKENGIDVWSLSGGNEVLLLFFIGVQQNSLNSTLMTAPIQRQWIRDHLKPVLMASNFSDVKILVLEDQRIFAPYWMKRFAEDPAALDAIDGIGLHWYFDWFTQPTILEDLHEKFPNKLIMYTESSVNFAFGTKVVDLGSWFHAEAYMFDLIENFMHWAQSYVDWNLCLTTDGGPYLGLPVDAAILVNATSGEFYKQPIFYAMGHFSKFIPPGSRRILVEYDQKYSSNHERLLQTELYEEQMEMFLKPKNFVPPSGNGSSIPLPIKVVIPQVIVSMATSNPDGSYSVIVLSSMNVTKHVNIEDARVGTISVDVEPSSINSFIYWVD